MNTGVLDPPPTADRNILYFSDHDNPVLSNFDTNPIRIGKTTWKSVEHYFQAMKFYPNREIMMTIQNSESPRLAKQFGQQQGIRIDWEDQKEEVMTNAVRAKFYPGSEIARVLLGTFPKTLIEKSNRDQYWGQTADGKGKNKMGLLLMNWRSDLRQLDALQRTSDARMPIIEIQSSISPTGFTYNVTRSNGLVTRTLQEGAQIITRDINAENLIKIHTAGSYIVAMADRRPQNLNG